MSEVPFSGAKPIRLIRWLDRFFFQCNLDMVPEVAAEPPLTWILTFPVQDLYRQEKAEISVGFASFGGGFSTWPGAVNHLI